MDTKTEGKSFIIRLFFDNLIYVAVNNKHYAISHQQTFFEAQSQVWTQERM